MLKLLLIALAPVLIIAVYVYFRDKYEKEPIRLLLFAVLAGILIIPPVILVERFIASRFQDLPHAGDAFVSAFLVAGFTEELFKFLALYILIWRNKNFNEKFDGIVYAVFVSLGFAGIENIMYVFNHGEVTGYIRAIVSVPGHALFGVAMGYYFGLAKFYPEKRRSYLILSLLLPIVLHGIFDFILMLENYFLMFGFLPYVVYLYISGLRRMKRISDQSIFRS